MAQAPFWCRRVIWGDWPNVSCVCDVAFSGSPGGPGAGTLVSVLSGFPYECLWPALLEGPWWWCGPGVCRAPSYSQQRGLGALRKPQEGLLDTGCEHRKPAQHSQSPTRALVCTREQQWAPNNARWVWVYTGRLEVRVRGWVRSGRGLPLSHSEGQ